MRVGIPVWALGALVGGIAGIVYTYANWRGSGVHPIVVLMVAWFFGSIGACLGAGLGALVHLIWRQWQAAAND